MSSEPDELNRPAQWWDETGEYELRQILHWRWDPIGVSSVFPYAADEYDDYALPAYAISLSSGLRPDGVGGVPNEVAGQQASQEWSYDEAASTRAASRTAATLDLPCREPASFAAMWSPTVTGSYASPASASR